MNKTITALMLAATLVFAAGSAALAQQAGGGPQPQLGTSTPKTQEGTTRPQPVQPGSPGTQSGTVQQPTTGGQGNNATSTEKK